MTPLRRTIAATGLALVLAAGGCTRADDTVQAGGLDATGTVTMDQQLHDRLPEAVRARGLIRLVTDASYAPMEYFAADGRTIIGFDADLAGALGDVLGIRVEMVVGAFDTALDEVAAGTYDGVLSSMTDTKQRQAKADFVDYLSTGTSILVQRGNVKGITELDDLCGQTVATEKGTYQEEMLQRIRAKCGAAGMSIHRLVTNADTLMELRTGRVAAVLQDYPPASFLATDERTSAFFQLASDQQYETGLFGIAVAKDDTALRDCLRAALQRLIDSGTYADLLARWELSASAVTEATVNGG
ncbi:polar amino acid transport system substrate-binding protein [Actinoplanes campanulatus]|uniref:Polar amino acid transport system substrate-binding protein n=1 Tax=Actinoplanes campanulatus TaxID=113559 RepID=A0A7W5FJL4_9ACTN|nr:ABC transporter substrate-binding protein [Actinoplanes campanulatus]MBB3100928.1 polar amino acid transport system substrate-binding protein [Actinoplanes campanulatus]GGN46704.1 ABC transporter substrate-binding protein [Actinoplanes campanulatus]GID41484.1 ABC transporter substrate-binding protein [Actinoplanes campanulatus]